MYHVRCWLVPQKDYFGRKLILQKSKWRRPICYKRKILGIKNIIYSIYIPFGLVKIAVKLKVLIKQNGSNGVSTRALFNRYYASEFVGADMDDK